MYKAKGILNVFYLVVVTFLLSSCLPEDKEKGKGGIFKYNLDENKYVVKFESYDDFCIFLSLDIEKLEKEEINENNNHDLYYKINDNFEYIAVDDVIFTELHWNKYLGIIEKKEALKLKCYFSNFGKNNFKEKIKVKIIRSVPSLILSESRIIHSLEVSFE